MNEYDDGRIWYKKKAGLVTVGLTEKVFEEIGSVQGISLPAEGDEVLQDDVVGEVEGVKTAFELVSPIDGTIEVVNEALVLEHELLESDPLDEGWIFKVRLTIPGEESEDEDDEE
jgi:glycine cleavage system H protein